MHIYFIHTKKTRQKIPMLRQKCYCLFSEKVFNTKIENCWKLSGCANIIFRRELLVELYLQLSYFMQSHNSFALGITFLRFKVK